MISQESQIPSSGCSGRMCFRIEMIVSIDRIEDSCTRLTPSEKLLAIKRWK